MRRIGGHQQQLQSGFHTLARVGATAGMPLKKPVGAERRMDLASFFCMIGRHGPAVALAVVAVVTVLAGFYIYRTVKGRRRKAACGDGAVSPAEEHRDASATQQRPLRSGESTGKRAEHERCEAAAGVGSPGGKMSGEGGPQRRERRVGVIYRNKSSWSESDQLFQGHSIIIAAIKEQTQQTKASLSGWNWRFANIKHAENENQTRLRGLLNFT